MSATEGTLVFDYYASQSAITDPGDYHTLFDDLPRDLAALMNMIQGLWEYWHGAQQRWVLVDPHVQALPDKQHQRQVDPLEITHASRFLLARGSVATVPSWRDGGDSKSWSGPGNN